MSVSDSVSDSRSQNPNSRTLTSYGDGAIWVETRAQGRKVWLVEVVIETLPNGRVKKTRRTATSRAEALRLRRELNALKAQRSLSSVTRTKFSEFALDWVREVKAPAVKEATAADYEYRIRRYLIPYFGSKDVSELGAREIQAWSTQLQGAGLGSRTINGARRVLFGIFRHAHRQGIVPSNPVAATESVRAREGERSQVRTCWDLAEAKATLNAAKVCPEMDLFMHLAIYCGLRHGELLGLTWSSLDTDAKTVTISSTLRDFLATNASGESHRIIKLTQPKTAASARTLPLSAAVLDALERHKRWQSERALSAGQAWSDTEFVFTSSIGTPISQTNNLKVFKGFLLRNGLRYIRIHDIRHTTAVLALEAGASLEWVSQAFGHRSTEITKTIYAPYVQVLNDRFSQALTEYLAT
jgi:integrase